MDLEQEGRAGAQSQRPWDGKLRLRRSENGTLEEDRASSPEIADEQAVQEIDGEEIGADQDLLDGYETGETDIDLNHSRIRSISALRLDKFQHIQRLCLRQNQISSISFPESPWGSKIEELDLYDNLIGHIRGIEHLCGLKSLDLSFNKIKNIKNVNHLTSLEHLYFVQNKISRIENLDGLKNLANLELAANRIRDIENLHSLDSIRELWLGKNKIAELKNLDSLKNLTLLSIQSNRVTSASLNHLCGLPNLTELYISHNQLTSVEGLSNCTSLRIVDISSNKITSLKGLKNLLALEELWASDCNLASLKDIETELHDKSKLETVYFEGNPVQKNNGATYRHKVMLTLPQVKQIDATYVRVA